MKIYTKTGDFGYTKYKGRMVSKDDKIFELFGVIDEAQAYIDFASNFTIGHKKFLTEISSILYKIMGSFYGENNDSPHLEAILEDATVKLEGGIDYIESAKPFGHNFLVLNSNQTTAALNIARVNVRRMERFLAAYKETHVVNSSILIFVNRLSDYLYALAFFYGDEQ